MKILATLHRRIFGQYRLRSLAGAIGELIPEGATVLDVGCGNGRLAAELMIMRPDIRIEGVDLESVPNGAIDIHYYDGTTIPYEDNSWDVCMANDVIHHCDEPLETLREMRRVARSCLLIKDHLADSRVDFEVLRWMDWLGNVGYGTPLPYNFWSTAAWKDAFQHLELIPKAFRTSLHLYPSVFLGLLDRKMHFLALLALDDGERPVPSEEGAA